MYPPPRPPIPPRQGTPPGVVVLIAVVCSTVFGFGGCAFGAAMASAPATPAETSRPAAAKKPRTPAGTTAPNPKTTIGDGTWRVGEDIEPGTWRAADVDLCHWRRLRGFSGRTGDVIASGTTVDGAAIATIEAGDVGFSSVGCNTWKRITPAAPKPTKASKVTMPKVVGKNGAAAEAKLKAVGLADVKFGSADPNASVVLLPENWRVTRQDPRAGAKVTLGAPVVLTVVKLTS